MMTESEAKQLILDTLAVMGKFAGLTPTVIDDRVVQMATAAVDSSLLWPWMWSLLERFLSDESDLLVGECPEPAAAAELGVNPLMIIALVKAIAELIKIFRK